ncbi:MAG TPA: methylmalonyl-CoA mutase family protein [Terracidiphilus sp.]|jgi:methylmalonyl-CoA mutase
MEHLLEEFPRVTTAEWEAAIARDLKGASYERRLVWRSEEGLAVKPYYRAGDLKDLAWMDAAPGEFPYRRGGRATGDWRIREGIDAEDAKTANREACAAVAAGAEEIAFSGVLVESCAQLKVLLRNLEEVPIHFERADERLIRLLTERHTKGRRASELSTGCDAMASVDFAAEIIEAAPARFVPFTIHGDAFEEAGATVAEEVGLTLAAGVDFVSAMQERGVEAGSAAAALEFGFAIGSNYFFQIAKLRAFRMVWARAIDSFGGARSQARAQIAARSSRWNKTVYDPHVNILRATTEAMAALIGGADSVMVAPYDACYRRPDEASRRLARNTQLLLKHEAGLKRAADAAGGSYAVETFTDFLASEGWRIMQEIEARGGYRKAQKDGAITPMLERSLSAREKAVVLRRRVFVGTNQFADPAERALDRCEAGRICETQFDATGRGTQAYEELRLRTERHAARGGSIPKVLLAEIGDVKMRAARSNFAANFFACAGMETVTRRFRKAAEIAEAKDDLIVLCSADPEYAAIIAELALGLKAAGRTTPVFVAGNPEDAASLAAAGVADFVHARSNPVEVVAKWQERLGM